MPSPRVTGLTTLCLLLSCRIVLGTVPAPSDQSSIAAPIANPANASGPLDIGNNTALPALVALPASTGTSTIGAPMDAANQHKFYSFTVTLRQTYDDNVGTSNNDKQFAVETSIAPGVVVDFPMENTHFSAGYSFDGTYYSQTAGTGNNVQYSHQFNAQLSHDFSERFSLNLADGFADSPEPNLYGTTGTPYRDGQNISNAFTAGLSAQWTPLLGTSTTYGNTLVRYLDNPTVAAGEDSLENTVSHTFSFSVEPTISANFGGVFDTIDYDQNPRGYTSYSGFIGGSWTALPNLSLGLRVGGSYTLTNQQEADGSTGTASQVSPYVDLSGAWQIGQRSSLTADYSHETTPSDYVGSSAAESDRVSATFAYQINSNLATHAQLSYTYSDVSGADIYSTGTTGAYTEAIYAFGAGISYNFAKYYGISLDISESGVSSTLPDADYDRQSATIGVRGTY